MTTKAAPANTPAGDFTYRFNPRTNKWHVFESGKFRRPFDTKEQAETFIDQERAEEDEKRKVTRMSDDTTASEPTNGTSELNGPDRTIALAKAALQTA